jgi:hypothetical protein
MMMGEADSVNGSTAPQQAARFKPHDQRHVPENHQENRKKKSRALASPA